jgi:hypothetical protein
VRRALADVSLADLARPPHDDGTVPLRPLQAGAARS